MARDFKRHSRKARHLMRRLRHEKHGAVQRMMAHELTTKSTAAAGDGLSAPLPRSLGLPGQYRPLTRRAKQILTRLRKTKVWSAQKRLLAEAEAEDGAGQAEDAPGPGESPAGHAHR